MNSLPSSLEQAPTPFDLFDSSPDNDSEVMRLCCPACQKELSLLRKHFGLEGNCVHCETPVKAIEDLTGHITVENLSLVHSPGAADFPISGVSEDNGSDDPIFGSSTVSAHQSPPPFLSEPEGKPDETPVIPPQFGEEKPSAAPPVFPEEDTTFSGKPERNCGIQSIPWTADSKTEEAPLMPDASAETPVPLFGSEPEKTSLFEDGSTSPLVESEISGEAKTPWDEQPPTKPGNSEFAETLFSGKPEGLGEETSLQSGDASSQTANKSPIGHPMQQASMEKLKSSGPSKGRSGLVRKLRNLVIIAVLASLGYFGYSMAPPEKVESAKAQIKEWLKPGAVLLEDLPFKIPGLSNDETSSHNKQLVVKRQKAPVSPEPAPEEKPE